MANNSSDLSGFVYIPEPELTDDLVLDIRSRPDPGWSEFTTLGDIGDFFFATAGGPFLRLSGGTMLGKIILSGDATSALEPVTLEQLNAAVTGGPFLPLAGVTPVTGTLNVSNAQLHVAWAQNSSTNGYFNSFGKFSGSLSGVPSNGTDQSIMLVQLTSDTLDSAAGVIGQYITMHSGGAAASGNRIGQYIDIHYAGSTLDHARGYPGMVSGIWAYAYGEGPMGGVPGNGYGQMWGGVISGRLTSGATNWLYCIGLEVDVGVAAGASASIVQGMKIVNQFNAQTPSAVDYYLGLAKDIPSNPGMPNGIVFGSLDGDWPLTATGTLIGTQASVVGGTTPFAAAWGIDFSAVTFSGGLIRGPVFSVNAAGKATTAGVSMGGGTVTSATDLSRHLDMYNGQFGMNVLSSGVLGIISGASGTDVYVSGTRIAAFTSNGLDATVVGAAFPTNGTFTNLVGTNVTGNASAVVGTGTNNILTFFPGPASNSPVTMQVSGTAGVVINAPAIQLGSAGGNQLNITAGASSANNLFMSALGTGPIVINNLKISGNIGFNNTPPIAKPTLTGAKGSNAALASVIAALVAYGLATDTTTA